MTKATKFPRYFDGTPRLREDARVQCRGCKRYMRFGPSTPKTPGKRRPSPHAGHCTECEPDHFACTCPRQKPMPW